MRSIGWLALLVALLAGSTSVPVVAQTPTDAAEATPAAASRASPVEASAAAASSTTSPSPAATDAAADGPVVRGVFFFSPTCPHCEEVITKHLPGIFEGYGGKPSIRIDESVPPDEVAFYLMSNGSLQLLMVDVSVDPGSRMLVADSERLGVDAAVPRLDIADRHLIGSVDIPKELPGILSAGLAAQGIDWPPVPDLAAALAPFPEAGSALSQAGTPRDDEVLLPAADVSVWVKVSRDPLGNGLAILVLVVLVASLVAVPLLLRRGTMPRLPEWPVPLLAILGIVISTYLGSVESSGVDAVCGPIGDCNAVQDSEWAHPGGVPMGVVGVLGYTLLLAGWVVARLLEGRLADVILVGVAAGAYLGTVFSAWLTFLEPFVIGATCLWCLSSAATMLALLWLTAGRGWAALRRLRGRTLRTRSA
jgi:uncharacterized membrane protein